MATKKSERLLKDEDILQRICKGATASYILKNVVIPRYGKGYISESHFRHLVREYRLIHGIEKGNREANPTDVTELRRATEPTVKKRSLFQRIWRSKGDGDTPEQIPLPQEIGIQQASVPQLQSGVISMPLEPISDKKVGKIHWRDLAEHIEQGRELKKKASWSQDYLTWELPEADRPIAFICISDFHFGSRSTDHSLIVRLTDEILSIPDLFVFVLGDMTHMAIKLRGVAEVADNAITPEMQMDLLESWLEDIGERIVCSTWDNHAVEREEKGTGVSLYKRIFNRKVAYHNGIGHVNIKVGQEVYKIAVSHTFRGRSIYNPIHAQMRYMKFEGQDREIALAGDSHVPGIGKWCDGATVRMALNTGSTQLDSGYGKRYFSLVTQPVFPCFTLHPTEHLFTPFWTVKEMLQWRDKHYLHTP